jgi:hypothetical protein
MRPTNPKDIMDAIAKEAEQIWGEDWFVQLVRRYCEIEGEITGTTPTAKSRRSTIERVLETGSGNVDTLVWLAAAVSAELQLAIHRIEIKRFS